MTTKKSLVIYYSYEDEEFAELTLEEIGALILGCMAYDQNKEIRKDAKKIIENNRTVRTIFRSLKGKTGRATEKWHDENNRREEGKLIKNIMDEYNCDKKEAKEILKKLKENSSIVSSDAVSDTPVIVSNTPEITSDIVSADNPHLLAKEYLFKVGEILTNEDLPFQINTYDMIAEYEKQYENNLPFEDELQDVLDSTLNNSDEKIRYLNILFNNGNADGWKKQWFEYEEREDK